MALIHFHFPNVDKFASRHTPTGLCARSAMYLSLATIANEDGIGIERVPRAEQGELSGESGPLFSFSQCAVQGHQFSRFHKTGRTLDGLRQVVTWTFRWDLHLHLIDFGKTNLGLKKNGLHIMK